MSKFRAWYLQNQLQITWFLIGFLCFGGLVDFGQGNYAGALLSWGIALINYALVRNR